MNKSWAWPTRISVLTVFSITLLWSCLLSLMAEVSQRNKRIELNVSYRVRTCVEESVDDVASRQYLKHTWIKVWRSCVMEMMLDEIMYI